MSELEVLELAIELVERTEPETVEELERLEAARAKSWGHSQHATANNFTETMMAVAKKANESTREVDKSTRRRRGFANQQSSCFRLKKPKRTNENVKTGPQSRDVG